MNKPPNTLNRWMSAAAAAAVFAASALITLACNDGDPGSSISDIVVDTDSAATQGDSTSPDQSRRGGILTIDSNDCGIFDPAIDLASSNLLPNLRLAGEIHAGLTRIGDAPDFAAEPELAGRFEPRSGSTEWEFTLKPNLKFSDGSPLTSADVKWSWERALRMATPPSRAHSILGSIAGAQEVAAGTSTELTGINLVDDQTLVVKLNAPATDFPTLLADPIASILKRENASQWENLWSNHETDPSTILAPSQGLPAALPVGAGPFQLIAYETPARIADGYSGDATCVLQRNQHYWHPDMPYLDGIIANARPDFLAPDSDSADRQLTALTGGALDFAVLDANADPSAAPAGTTSQVAPLSTWSRFLVFNPSIPPFNDPDVRRALVQSVDTTRDANRFESTPNLRTDPTRTPAGRSSSAAASSRHDRRDTVLASLRIRENNLTPCHRTPTRHSQLQRPNPRIRLGRVV